MNKNQTGIAFYLVLLILLVWLYVDGRIMAAGLALAGKRVLA